jgi:hypothetical protein
MNIEDQKANEIEDDELPKKVSNLRNDSPDNSVKKKLTERPKLMRH